MVQLASNRQILYKSSSLDACVVTRARRKRWWVRIASMFGQSDLHQRLTTLAGNQPPLPFALSSSLTQLCGVR
eukprot:2137538-Amphidinium_carterae.1